MKHFILSLLIFTSISLNALTYDETVRAYEEALENQSATVYMLKCQREDEKNRQIREAYRNMSIKRKEAELQKMIDESNERLK
jgi:predicted Holliday junction resolvase-like endonuclease